MHPAAAFAAAGGGELAGDGRKWPPGLGSGSGWDEELEHAMTNVTTGSRRRVGDREGCATVKGGLGRQSLLRRAILREGR